jgi:hypothetical protein
VSVWLFPGDRVIHFVTISKEPMTPGQLPISDLGFLNPIKDLLNMFFKTS